MKKPNPAGVLLCTSLLFITASAHADSTGHLGVNGKILPTGCELSLGTDAGVDLGSISHADLLPDDEKELKTIDIETTVTCKWPTKFGLRFTDNTSPDAPDDQERFNLVGAEPNSKLGHYYVELLPAITDSSESVRFLLNTGGLISESRFARPNRESHYHALFKRPKVQLANFNMKIHPRLSSKEAFSAEDDTSLVGTMSVELLYL